MKSLALVTLFLALYSNAASASGEVLYTCSAEGGAAFSFPIRRGNSNPSLVIWSDSTPIRYSAEQYRVAAWEGKMLDPHQILILDSEGERLIEMKDGKLIDAQGKVHTNVSCFVEA